MKIKFVLLTLLLLNTLTAGTIKVAVAANVSYAIDDLKKAFKLLHPDTKVQVILGSSGKLTAQIKHGAPYHLFLSADMKFPEVLYHDNVAITKPQVYAEGSLAFLSTKEQDFSKAMALCKEPHIDKIAMGNPKTAPYGKATYEAMKNSGIYKDITKKLVFAESISQTLSYTVTACDLGFIAKSALFSPKMRHFKKGIHWMDVNSSLYTAIEQGVVILKEGKDNPEASVFYDFILSSKAQEIFKKFGYNTP